MGAGSGRVLIISFPTTLNLTLSIRENPTPIPTPINSGFSHQNWGGSRASPTGLGPLPCLFLSNASLLCIDFVASKPMVLPQIDLRIPWWFCESWLWRTYICIRFDDPVLNTWTHFFKVYSKSEEDTRQTNMLSYSDNLFFFLQDLL